MVQVGEYPSSIPLAYPFAVMSESQVGAAMPESESQGLEAKPEALLVSGAEGLEAKPETLLVSGAEGLEAEPETLLVSGAEGIEAKPERLLVSGAEGREAEPETRLLSGTQAPRLSPRQSRCPKAWGSCVPPARSSNLGAKWSSSRRKVGSMGISPKAMPLCSPR